MVNDNIKVNAQVSKVVKNDLEPIVVDEVRKVENGTNHQAVEDDSKGVSNPVDTEVVLIMEVQNVFKVRRTT